MSRLHDPRFLGFGGESVTGRVPPRVIVHDARTLTPVQEAALAHEYKLFRDIRAVSTAPHQVRNLTLRDGSRVRITSHFDQDEVQVWPVDAGPTPKLPHGLLVVTEWSDPSIYRKGASGWSVATDDVPQAREPILAYGAVEMLPGSGFRSWPMVRSDTHLWDCARHGKTTLGSSPEPVPINLFVAGKLTPHAANFAVGDKIYKADGSLLYTMPASSNILVDLSDTLNTGPGNADTRGNVAVLQSYRRGVLSPTFEIVKYRFCNEALNTPAAPTTYAVVERNVTDLTVAPTGSQVVVTTNTTAANLNEAVDTSKLFAKYLSIVAGASTATQTRLYTGPTTFTLLTDSPFSVLWGVTIQSATLPALTRVTDGYYELHDEAGDSTITAKLVAGAGEDDVEFYAWQSALAYPENYYWVAGADTYSFDPGSIFGLFYPAYHWVVRSAQIDRRVAEFERIVAPEVKLDIPWVPSGFVVLSGSGSGVLEGRFNKDVDIRFTNLDTGWNDTTQLVTSATAPAYDFVPPSPPGYPYTRYDGFGYFATAQGGSIATTVQAAHDDHQAGATVIVANDKLFNTIDYVLTSRHIIDFDSRSRFIAAIKVVVTCAGARWDAATVADAATGAGAVNRGLLIKTTDPTYTVEIYFESAWYGAEGTVTASQLLASASATRAGFEFETLTHENVYTYPFVTAPITYYMPPTVAPPDESAAQLINLLEHQGVNPHLAAEYFKTGATTHRSARGIEYSVIDKGIEVPPNKYCAGQLYARSFKLSDVADALWLLRATKCDATLNDAGAGAEYYYMPALKTTIDSEVFHIELRDGALTSWSDDIPAKAGETQPLLADRDSIQLFQV